MVAAVVIAVGWVVVVLVAWRAGVPALARIAAVLVAAHLVSGWWHVAAPLTVAAWLWCALALPDGALLSRTRRIVAASGGVLAAVTTGWLAVAGASLGWAPGLGGSTLAIAVATAGVVRRCRRAGAAKRGTLQWVAAAVVVLVATDVVLLAVHELVGTPAAVRPWLVAALVLVPLGVTAGVVPAWARVAERALVEAIVVAGLAVMVVAVYLVVVIGLGHKPVGDERAVLVGSVVAALSAVVLALPVRSRLVTFGQTLLGRADTTPEEALASFGARMSRAVPFDELLLQLAESLRATLGTSGAEVWVGTEGVLSRTVSVPERPVRRLVLTGKERIVVGRTRVGGAAWLSVWLPDLVAEQPPTGPIRVAPAAHLGELLGMLVVRRSPGDADLTADEEGVLVELARQVGLALHNMRLDSALQASLQELRVRNEELQASRLRIVTTADASRRAIERDLHDGAQQHLVALSVKLGLAHDLVTDEPVAAAELLDELRTDVQDTIRVLRELAHGIYPPLLRNHGLDQALRSVTRRAALPCEVTVDLSARYPEAVEAAVYFCCLEAVQNAGKHAGTDASITVRVWADDDLLRFAVTDDGLGFTAAGGSEPLGSGFVNMSDRLGAIGGRLHVESSPGAGATVSGEIPLPVPAPVAEPV